MNTPHLDRFEDAELDDLDPQDFRHVTNELELLASIGLTYPTWGEFTLLLSTEGAKPVFWPIPALRTVREVRELAERMHAATIKPVTPAACPNGCDHTDEEHEAFDLGLKTGESGVEWEAPEQYTSPSKSNLLEAWESGRSVGRLNAK